MSEIESLRVGEWFYGPMALGSIVLNSIDCFCIICHGPHVGGPKQSTGFEFYFYANDRWSRE